KGHFVALRDLSQASRDNLKEDPSQVSRACSTQREIHNVDIDDPYAADCSASQVFDEKHRVAAFVVEQLVHQILGEQNAEASGAPAFLGAHSTWRIGESAGLEMAACGRKSSEKPLPGS